MSVVCDGRMIAKLAILVRRCSSVTMALVWVWLGYGGIRLLLICVLLPRLVGSGVGHKAGVMIELVIPRLRAILLDGEQIIIGRIGEHVLPLKREVIIRHVTWSHAMAERND